ncbi:MAG: prepilin peptidase [Candidatus Omnitrophica bacterium]|nr:prepilin peptidase [Candidatus Omnitrophota bacterium]
MTIAAVFVFILGTALGSFFNVCIHRMPRGESIIFPASHCPACKKNILWYDNIPVLSYFALGGRCRSCKARISFRYPLVELATGFLLAALFVNFGLTPKFFAYSVMACVLIVSAFIDFETGYIFYEITIGGIIAGLLFAVLFPSVMNEAARIGSVLDSIAGLIAGGGSIFILKFLGTIAFKKKVDKLGIKSAMGEGDVVLMAMIGAFIGAKLVLFTFFAAPFFGVVPGIVAKIGKGKDTIPYGPFLAIAAFVAIFFGDAILRFLFGGFF